LKNMRTRQSLGLSRMMFAAIVIGEYNCNASVAEMLKLKATFGARRD